MNACGVTKGVCHLTSRGDKLPSIFCITGCALLRGVYFLIWVCSLVSYAVHWSPLFGCCFSETRGGLMGNDTLV